jgi:hypothetical protein
MKRPGLRDPSFLRVALAGVAVMDLFSFGVFLADARAQAVANGVALGGFAEFLSRPIVCGAVMFAGIAAGVAFAWRAGRLWEGAAALAALALLSSAHAQLFGSPWRHLFYSGLCLSGWLLGAAVSRRHGEPTDEWFARTGALALLGAAYLNAGISKLVFGGWEWMSALPIQAVIVGQDGLVADGPLSLYRSWVVNTPAAGALFSLATTGFELAGPLMLWGGRTRLVVALGLFAMHTNIYLLTAILYWESMVLLALFGLSPDPPPAERWSMAPAGRVSRRAFAGAAALLTVAALLAIAHQTRRFAHTAARQVAAVEPPAARAPTVSPLSQVGPFTVGQTLAAEWSIESLTLSDDGFVAALSGTPGRAAFEVTCSSSPHRSPFDLGPAHIFYSSELQFPDLEAVGLAVRDEVRKAADGGEVCDRVASWRTSARAGEMR